MNNPPQNNNSNAYFSSQGTFLVSQLVCNAMIERAEAEGGSVVNIASLAGRNGLAMHCQYAATKGGVMAFTKSIAKELAK